jgi:hypothetical protein
MGAFDNRYHWSELALKMAIDYDSPCLLQLLLGNGFKPALTSGLFLT